MIKDFHKLIFWLLGISIVAVAGAIVDVQLLKKDIRSQEDAIKEINVNTKWLKERWIEKFGRE